MVVYKGTKLIFLSAIFVVSAFGNEGDLVRSPRQTHSKNNQHDQSSAETGFLGGGGVENSKYFHYQHLPEHDKYEFGHRRGNDHHVIERYEKAIPHEGQFKTKVRWADKKGGHGEHYWDYNHAGHGGNGQNDGDGGYSNPVPIYTNQQKTLKQHKRQSESEKRLTLEDIEKSDQSEASRTQDANGFVRNIEKEIGGVQAYDVQRDNIKQKRTPKLEAIFSEGSSQKAIIDGSRLFLHLENGKVVDEITGKKYVLQPVD